jgi:hypothetical protein
MIDDVSKAAMKMLQECEPMQVFKGANGVARFGIMCEIAAQGCQQTAAGRPQNAMKFIDTVAGVMIQGLPSGPFRQKVKTALSDFRYVIGEAVAAKE